MNVLRNRAALWALVLILIAGSMANPIDTRASTSGVRLNPGAVHLRIERPTVVPEVADVHAHHCGAWIIGNTQYTIPGWWPAAEAVTVYTVGAVATYFYGRFVRIAPPWWVSHGGGALWAAIEATWITGKFQAGDVVVQRNYENCHQFTFYHYHYRNGGLVRAAVRTIEKSSCAQVNALVRSIASGQTTVRPGTRFMLNCPASYSP